MAKKSSLSALIERSKNTVVTPNEAQAKGFKVNQDGVKRRLFDLLSFPDISVDCLRKHWQGVFDESPEILEQFEIEAKYSVYIERQKADVISLKRDEAMKLPAEIPYDQISGLSNEVVQKLKTVQPTTIGQASRVDGVTPAALSLLLAFIKRKTAA